MTTKIGIREDCGYNKIFKYQWTTSTYALPMSTSHKLDKMCVGKWGWHFIPHKNMNYSRENWYEDQTLVLTFQNKWDFIHARLRVSV